MLETMLIKQGFCLITALLITSSGWAASYQEQYDSLKNEIEDSLPGVSSFKEVDFEQALEAEQASKKDLKAAETLKDKLKEAKALVGHAKGKWIGGANKGIKDAEAQLKAAQNQEEREAAEAELEKWQKDLEAGQQALKERQEALDQLDAKDIASALTNARQAVEQAQENTVKATEALGLASVLDNDNFDRQLARFIVLHEATPEKLEAYASQSSAHRQRIERMLSDDALLIQMGVADGAAGGDYGRSMEIYETIQKECNDAAEGTLQRLALAISLEHAVPRGQRNAVGAVDARAFVDPVKRYHSYKKAFLAQELDPAFQYLTVWDMRMVVNGEEPDEISAWGREMLRNYRPDHVTTSDQRWRYVGLVRTDIPYGSEVNQYDKDELQFFQNILMNGGVCGRRAFIGRFILRAFGVPTTARPQTGHAALVRWTPDGWVTCLGGGWGAGWTRTLYGVDRNFLATTQARALGDSFMKVKRAHWIGDVMEEPRVYGFHTRNKKVPSPGFWNAVALNTQRALIANAETLAPVGEEIAEADDAREALLFSDTEMTKKDREVDIDRSGVIRIPAVATREPGESTKKIKFLPSTLGGFQLLYARGGNPEDFEYRIDAPRSGLYTLTARVVTPSWQQKLLISVNDDEEAVELELPHTVGLWEETKPIQLQLKRGKNTLRFSHTTSGKPKGFAIHELTLSPSSDLTGY